MNYGITAVTSRKLLSAPTDPFRTHNNSRHFQGSILKSLNLISSDFRTSALDGFLVLRLYKLGGCAHNQQLLCISKKSNHLYVIEKSSRQYFTKKTGTLMLSTVFNASKNIRYLIIRWEATKMSSNLFLSKNLLSKAAHKSEPQLWLTKSLRDSEFMQVFCEKKINELHWGPNFVWWKLVKPHITSPSLKSSLGQYETKSEVTSHSNRVEGPNEFH